VSNKTLTETSLHALSMLADEPRRTSQYTTTETIAGTTATALMDRGLAVRLSAKVAITDAGRAALAATRSQ